jgi:hypothetical protein
MLNRQPISGQDRIFEPWTLDFEPWTFEPGLFLTFEFEPISTF